MILHKSIFILIYYFFNLFQKLMFSSLNKTPKPKYPNNDNDATSLFISRELTSLLL